MCKTNEVMVQFLSTIFSQTLHKGFSSLKFPLIRNSSLNDSPLLRAECENIQPPTCDNTEFQMELSL